ncbi:hypothetical protein CROQUDRAFT_717119 [Cronartium quercuum f. sp. fusiforme G11]|uniref:Uncharacterized protein n=1 Tax=Cronartium quercuum f. sp. fusiforme G11 TaxID=708437 RepID=A0A9P6T9G9_9BASI|nr:hypothetical protein CROQUDRAFT_717119 [Cronartium quercuum f. sp. fusiforme G11]
MSILSSLQHSILAARVTHGSPPSTNFMRDNLGTVKSLVNPPFPPWALALLFIFATFRAVLIAISAGIILLPAFRGPESRKRHYYLVRRVYSTEYRGMPYLVPNRSMVITLGEFCSSVFYLISVCMHYRFYTAPIMPRGTALPLWYCITGLPSAVGIWMAGWGLFFACFCNVPDTKKRDRNSWTLAPRLYNFLWISWVLVVVSSITAGAIKVMHDWDRLEGKITRIIQEINQAADLYDLYHEVSLLHMTSILAQRDAIYQALRQLTSTIDMICYFAIVFYLTLGVFYLVTISYLLRLCSNVLSLRVKEWVAPQVQSCSVVWMELEAEFKYQSRLSVGILLTIGCQICWLIYEWLVSSHWDVARIKLSLGLLDQLPGVFAAPTLLFQSWRIIGERYSADESTLGQVSADLDSNQLPHLAAKLLGWDSTEHWGIRPSIQLDAFSKLGDVNDSVSDESNFGCAPTGKTNNLVSGISIQRITATTEDTS